MVTEIDIPALKTAVASEILNRLPAWFGIPESTAEYISGVADLPFWADTDAEMLRGFIALKQTGPKAAEIYVIGVLPEYHRHGVGRGLFEALEQYARDKGYSYLQVKTVSRGVWESYDITNDFYTAMGFEELDRLQELWGKENPCQIYVKAI